MGILDQVGEHLNCLESSVDEFVQYFFTKHFKFAPVVILGIKEIMFSSLVDRGKKVKIQNILGYYISVLLVVTINKRFLQDLQGAV